MARQCDACHPLLSSAAVPVADRIAEQLVLRTPLRDRALRKRLVRARRRAFERAGSERFSRPANSGLEAKLLPWVGDGPGIFVEAGANDGFTQSNTYWFERFRGWSGVLVEGIPELAAECRLNRDRSQIFACALVAPEDEGTTITMRYGDVVSLVAGSQGSAEEDAKHLELYGDIAPTYDVEVPGRTLSSVLDEAGTPHVDLLSLDLEGYELNALRGLDLERHRPRLVLVEAHDAERLAAIDAQLGERYERVAQLELADFLYRAR